MILALSDPMRTTDAAELVHRPPATIRSWVERGWVRRHRGHAGRQSLVDRGDVLRADAALAAGRTPTVVRLAETRPARVALTTR